MSGYSTPLKNNMYDARVYHMDLCILAYHLYHQSIIWPMDPYFESMTAVSNRADFMSEARTYLLANKSSYPELRGPGGLSHGLTNSNLDPIITKYDRVDPWNVSFIRPETEWEYIKPSSFITNKIKNVYSCEDGSITIAKSHPNENTTATDNLYCFEGATGSTSEDEKSTKFTSPAWSLMGFVLARSRGAAGGYDIHITFRGSRSGSAGRALKDALLKGIGNADWVTDMDFKKLLKNNSLFGAVGGVSEGFALSIQSTFTNICRCLEAAYDDNQSQAPVNIYVTGHSLGGALAAMCACALSKRSNSNHFTKLKSFPFESLRLLSYSAPTVGDMDFVRYYNSRISASRFLIDGDPVTSSKLESFGVHVGAKVILPQIEDQSAIGTDAHEPKHVRAQIVSMLEKEKIILSDSANPILEKYGNLNDLIMGQFTGDNAPSIAESLPFFGSNFDLYLKIFYNTSACLGKSVMPKILSLTPKTNLKTLYQTLAQNDKMTKFFGLCFALENLSTSAENLKIKDLTKELEKHGFSSNVIY